MYVCNFTVMAIVHTSIIFVKMSYNSFFYGYFTFESRNFLCFSANPFRNFEGNERLPKSREINVILKITNLYLIVSKTTILKITDLLSASQILISAC